MSTNINNIVLSTVVEKHARLDRKNIVVTCQTDNVSNLIFSKMSNNDILNAVTAYTYFKCENTKRVLGTS